MFSQVSSGVQKLPVENHSVKVAQDKILSRQSRFKVRKRVEVEVEVEVLKVKR